MQQTNQQNPKKQRPFFELDMSVSNPVRNIKPADLGLSETVAELFHKAFPMLFGVSEVKK